MVKEILGEGNTAQVYIWNEKEILKLYRDGIPTESVKREYYANKEVEKLGLAVPKVGDMIEYEGRDGIIYERIQGNSLLELISKKPWCARGYAKQIAKMHYDMHQKRAESLQSGKETFAWCIRHTKELTEKQKGIILGQLMQMPDGDAVCHGDFHPGNIIKTSKDYIILDWMTAVKGNPGADVARTLMLLKDAGIPGTLPKPVKFMITLTRKNLADTYLKAYVNYSGISIKEIEQWRLPIIAARLSEWIPESERKALLNEINEKINQLDEEHQ